MKYSGTRRTNREFDDLKRQRDELDDTAMDAAEVIRTGKRINLEDYLDGPHDALARELLEARR